MRKIITYGKEAKEKIRTAHKKITLITMVVIAFELVLAIFATDQVTTMVVSLIAGIFIGFLIYSKSIVMGEWLERNGSIPGK